MSRSLTEIILRYDAYCVGLAMQDLHDTPSAISIGTISPPSDPHPTNPFIGAVISSQGQYEKYNSNPELLCPV